MTEKLPSRDECLVLLKNAGCSESVIAHSMAVENRALKIAQLAKADSDLVCCGALLHDIGRSKTHKIQHAVIGADMARELGLPEEVSKIIERHIGAGLSPVDAQKLDLPNRNYIPETLEEKIVAHADNLIEDHKKRLVSKVIRDFEELGYKDVAEKVLALHNELSEICGIDLDNI
jgi:tRNA (cytidine56-2'-O)-methyltransferase